MDNRFSWVEISRCYKKNVGVLFGNDMLRYLLVFTASVIALGILYVVSQVFFLPVGEFSVPNWIDLAREGKPSYYSLIYVWLLPYLAWITYGWHHFMLRLVRTGCNEYELIYSTPIHRILPAMGLGVLYAVPIVLGQYVLTIPYQWPVVFFYLLYVVMFSRMLFAWYYLIDGSSIWQALVRSNRHAQKYLFVTLLTAVVRLTLPVLPIAELGKSPILLLISVILAIGLILVDLFFAYLIARLYTETGCKTHEDCFKRT